MHNFPDALCPVRGGDSSVVSTIMDMTLRLQHVSRSAHAEKAAAKNESAAFRVWSTLPETIDNVFPSWRKVGRKTKFRSFQGMEQAS